MIADSTLLMALTMPVAANYIWSPDPARRVDVWLMAAYLIIMASILFGEIDPFALKHLGEAAIACLDGEPTFEP